jgi:hypothetical protein
MSTLSYAQSINLSKSVCEFANTNVSFQPACSKGFDSFLLPFDLDIQEQVGGLGFAGFQGIV